MVAVAAWRGGYAARSSRLVVGGEEEGERYA